MSNSHRSVVVIFVLCLAIFGIFAVGKISAISFNNNEYKNESVISSDVSLTQNVATTESAFYESSPVTVTTTNTFSDTPAVISSELTPVESNSISALSYLAGNVITGKIYLQKNERQILPEASMSKLVTAFVATDILPATSTITITKDEANEPPDGSGISQGETYSLNELLYPLLLDSSNIAAEALASSTNRTNFLELMSSYAWEIGMSTAYFADPSGINPHNAASALDLFALARYLYRFRPDILALTRVASILVGTTTEHGSHDFVSIHPFVHDPNFIGGKTGRTPEAGDTMLTIMNINNQPVAIVVLGSKYDGRAEDTQQIIDKVESLLKI